MGLSTVATLTPLVGTLGSGAATGSMFPERDATTIPEDVDETPAEEYEDGLATLLEGALCPISQLTSMSSCLGIMTHAFLNFLRSRLLLARAFGGFLIREHRERLKNRDRS